MARSRTWPAQPAALAAVLVLAAAGAAIGWRVGGSAAAVVGVGVALVVALLLVIAADRLGSTPAGARRRADGRRQR